MESFSSLSLDTIDEETVLEEGKVFAARKNEEQSGLEEVGIRARLKRGRAMTGR